MRAPLDVVVMAGGEGTRLWPLSRRAVPKPILPLAGGPSPLQRALALGRRIAGKDRVWLVASRLLARLLRTHLGKEARVRWVFEPAACNTAAALALACATVHRRRGDGWVLCLPADQWIRKPAGLVRLVRRIVAAGARDHLVTFGIPARRPHPGYGYIEPAGRISADLHQVRRFVEKPRRSRAARYIRSGRWVWNSGMFLWPSATFLDEVRRLLPSLARVVDDLVSGKASRRKAAARAWRGLEPLSVDHGVLARARRVAVARRDIGWNDLGTWDALGESMRLAPDGSRHLGEYRSIDGADCFAYAPGRLVFNLGVRGTGLVVTADAVLLFDRRQHERIREVVERLRQDPALRRYR